MQESPLRLPAQEEARPQARDEQPTPEVRPLPPLALAGVVVTKGQLIKALQVYIPAITDIVLLDEKGEHFYLRFGEPSVGDPASQTGTPQT